MSLDNYKVVEGKDGEKRVVNLKLDRKKFDSDEQYCCALVAERIKRKSDKKDYSDLDAELKKYGYDFNEVQSDNVDKDKPNFVNLTGRQNGGYKIICDRLKNPKSGVINLLSEYSDFQYDNREGYNKTYRFTVGAKQNLEGQLKRKFGKDAVRVKSGADETQKVVEVDLTHIFDLMNKKKASNNLKDELYRFIANNKQEPVDWITVNGTHIPIYEGEYPDEAVKRFVKEEDEKAMKKWKKEMDPHAKKPNVKKSVQQKNKKVDKKSKKGSIMKKGSSTKRVLTLLKSVLKDLEKASKKV